MSSATVPPTVVSERRGRRRWGGGADHQGWQGYLFALPALVLLGAFLVWPVIYTVEFSLHSGLYLRLGRWVGLDNYKRLFQSDPLFLDTSKFPPAGALVNNLFWVVVSTSLCLGLGLLIAVLATRVRYEKQIKAVVFAPMAIAATATAIIWLFVFSGDKDIGVVNAVLTHVIPGFDSVDWTGRADTVNWALIIAYVWATTGFAMVVLSAAIKGISEDVLEAARVDGATEWQIFRRIQLPLLSLPMSVVTVWLIINVIKLFDLIYIMTKGGPGGASRVIAYTMYTETFIGGNGGYGAAVAVVMLLLIIPIMIFNIRRFRTAAVQG